MKFERRDDERWHLATINCGNSETVHETVHVDPDDGFTRINGTVRLSLPFVDDPSWCDTCQAIVAERYSQSRTPIYHYKVATTLRDVEWSDYDGAIGRCA